MPANQPIALWGLRVPAGNIPIPATRVEAAFHVKMAAIDPTEAPANADESRPLRATLKIIRLPEEDDDDESMDEDQIRKAIMMGGDDDDDDDISEDETNGGPSDPAKVAETREKHKLAQIKKEQESDSDMSMDDAKPNGILKNKGKGRALGEEDDEDSEEGMETEEFVICTLDPQKTYQLPLDLFIGEDEQVYFKVTGDFDIHLTGNYLVPDTSDLSRMHDDYEDSDEEDEHDLSPLEDELDDLDEMDEGESDEVDEEDIRRVTEITTSDEEGSKPTTKIAKVGKVAKPAKAGKDSKAEKGDKAGVLKNGTKRPAEQDPEEEATNLDDIMEKSLKNQETGVNGDKPLSKKEKKKLKKLKNNAGEAADAPDTSKATDTKDSASPAVKKVHFEKDEDTKAASGSKGKSTELNGAKEDSAKTGVPRVVKGVTVMDGKIGIGKAAKSGDRVEMRYIGKLKDGKVFDKNVKGKGFGFKLGAGEVISGWDIGIIGMKVGGERRLTIPAHLAYGSKKQAGIPANSPLTFEVKMLNVQ